MTGWLIGGGLWLAALVVLAPHVGHALRRSRLRLDDTPGELRAFQSLIGPWDERPDHLFDLRDSTDRLYQGWTHSQVDRFHGPLTLIPRPEQDQT